MEFDFYQRYKNATDDELLKVLQHPEQYQPAVIDTIKRILSERGTTVEALQVASIMPEAIGEPVQSDGQEDLLTEPWEETKPPLWVTLVLVAVALQFVWSFLSTFYEFYRAMAGFDLIEFFLYFTPIIYLPVTGYLLLKKRVWGWILLFDLAVFLVSMASIWLINITWYGNFYWQRLLSPLWKLVFNGALLFCLWKPEMLRYFGVSEEKKRKTLGISIGVTLFIILIATLKPW